jgi:hypothetical protein
MMRRALFAMLLGAATPACGEVAPFSDAGDDDSSPDAATAAVALESTGPAADAVGVDVLTELTLTFTGAVDEASLDGAVAVYERSSRRRVPVADVTWDATTRTATIQLARPLYYQTQYRVETTGVTAGGDAVDVPTFRFRTYINQYQRGRGYADGRATSRADGVLDAEGFFDQWVYYAAGSDGVVDTADDAISYWYDYSYQADGSYTGSVNHTGTGPDEVWLTADDTIGGYSAYEYGDAGQHRVRQYNGPGPDDQWRTADDTLAYWQSLTYDDQDRIVRLISYTGLGPDREPYTADDVPSFVNDTSYPSATTIEQINYSGPGADATWLTGDDVIGYRSVSTLDAAGNYIAWRSLDASGAIQQHQLYTLDEAGLVTRVRRFTDPGPDQTWLTSDDVATQYYDYDYDAAHRRTQTLTFDVGSDGQLDTADDVRTYALLDYDPVR